MTHDDIESNLVSHADAIADLDARVAAVEAKLAEPKPAAEPKYLVLDSHTMRRLPCDFAEAIEQCKLAIIRHRAGDWFEISQAMAVGAFESLARLAAGEPVDRRPEHVCGLQGFDPMRGDSCPACNQPKRPRIVNSGSGKIQDG